MIRTSIPSDVRKPGVYVEFDTVSAARGLVPIRRRVALVGAALAAPAWVTLTAYVLGDMVRANGNLYRVTIAGTAGATAPSHTAGTAADGTATWLYVQAAPQGATATPYQMLSDSDGELFFGRGSELAIMVRAAFKAAAFIGSQPEIWASACAEPVGAKAGKTLTVTGPANVAGDVVLMVNGRAIRVGLSAGATATAIAAAIKATLDRRLSEIPITPSVAAGVVSLAATHTGVNGNDLKVSVDSTPSGVTVTIASTAGSGAYDITTALDALSDKTYQRVAIWNHTSVDVADLKAFAAARGSSTAKAWCMTFMAETATLATATTLATLANDRDVHVITAEDAPSGPGELAAAVATASAARRPGYNFDGAELPFPPMPLTSVPTDTEIETALNAGCTPLTVNFDGDGLEIVSLSTTKTTEGGAAFENLRDSSNVAALYYTATQCDLALRRIMASDAKADLEMRKLARSTVIDTLRAVEGLKIIHHVDDHLDEIVVDTDPNVPTRLVVGIPTSVVPDLHQMVTRHILFVEG